MVGFALFMVFPSMVCSGCGSIRQRDAALKTARASVELVETCAFVFCAIRQGALSPLPKTMFLSGWKQRMFEFVNLGASVARLCLLECPKKFRMQVA